MFSFNNSSSEETNSLGGSILNILDSAYNSRTFLIIQIIIGIYCSILIFNIVYTSIKLSLFGGRARQLLTGSKEKPEQYELTKELSETNRILEMNKKIISNSPSDWKLAIIEADKILDKTLEAKGFQGASLGDKLKQMVPADLPETYEEVWEAHKIRNRIVHEPEYEIGQNETRKIVGVYERALKKLTR